ncbi:MAG: L,D-transpeptidase family protein [Candidatus Omnitrophica bacterium]|nr:L,D-transpeptidase family protein [Candidatus Omnitrophota bacterium]
MKRTHVMVMAGLFVVVAVGVAGWTVWQQPAVLGGLLPGQGGSLLRQADAQAQAGHPDEAIRLCEQVRREHPEGAVASEAAWRLGQLYEQVGRLLDAQEAYQQAGGGARAQEALQRVRVELLFSPTVGARDTTYTIQPGDTLAKIAKQYHTTVDLLQRANHLSGDLILPGRRLKVTTATFTIAVQTSTNTLTLEADHIPFKRYRISTGANRSTPLGTFTIVNKVPHPAWYKVGAVVPANSPENILGTRWLGLSQSGYGIHGTTDPQVLGQAVTAGCVRMANADVEELFTIVPLGTTVTITE